MRIQDSVDIARLERMVLVFVDELLILTRTDELELPYHFQHYCRAYIYNHRPLLISKPSLAILGQQEYSSSHPLLIFPTYGSSAVRTTEVFRAEPLRPYNKTTDEPPSPQATIQLILHRLNTHCHLVNPLPPTTTHPPSTPSPIHPLMPNRNLRPSPAPA